MALTFYFAPMSTSNITDAVLRELGCAVTRIQVSLQAGDARTPEFLRLNPNGEVPLIIDDGVAIWESAAITLYLGDRYGAAAGLFPASGPRRGEAMSWVVWASNALAPTAGRVAAAAQAAEQARPKAHPQDANQIGSQTSRGGLDASKAALDRYLDILDGALAERDFLLGAYSLVDAHVFVVLDWIAFMEIDLGPRRNLIDWIARCRRERPALTVGDSSPP